MAIKENVKNFRESANLSIADFSKKVGISSKSLGEYEEGKKTIPESNLKRIALALGTTVDILKEESNKELKVVNKGKSGEKIKSSIDNNELLINEFLLKYNDLDKEGKDAVIEVLNNQLNRKN